ncbi:hypothetical protein OC861_004380 [Tilletia horrida]|nr:hypothetical protein OC861_004380 [Tilletia horrida]
MQLTFMKATLLSFLSLFPSLCLSHKVQLSRRDRHPLINETTGLLNRDALQQHGHFVQARYARRFPQQAGHRTSRSPKHDSKHVTRAAEQLHVMNPSVGWVGSMIVGGQELRVWYDTGSFDIITNGPTYDPDQSDTCYDSGRDFSVQYFDNSNTRGHVYYETISIAGLVGSGVAIGASESRLDRLEEDAIAGMGPYLHSSSTFGPNSRSFPYALKRSGAIQRGMFAFSLSKTGYSELSFGNYNTGLMRGGIQWVPLLRDKIWWTVQGNFLGRNLKMMVDSGTTYLTLETNLFFDTVGRIPGVTVTRWGDHYIGLYDCRYPPQGIAISFGSMRFPIDGDLLAAWRWDYWRCVLPVMSMDHLKPDMPMVAGEILFQRSYIVFDFDNFQMGFAQRAYR